MAGIQSISYPERDSHYNFTKFPQFLLFPIIPWRRRTVLSALLSIRVYFKSGCVVTNLPTDQLGIQVLRSTFDVYFEKTVRRTIMLSKTNTETKKE